MKQFLITAAAIAILSVSAPCWARDHKSQFIPDPRYAPRICPITCKSHAGWNGNWKCSLYAGCVCGCFK